MKSKYGLFIAIGLVIGISLLAIGILYLNSPTEIDIPEYTPPYTPDYSVSQSHIPIFDGYHDGYHGRDPNPPPYFTNAGYKGREKYFEEYLMGINDRMEEMESQINE